MDLKEFITETISAIVDATADLQGRYEPQGIIINPPVSLRERDLYDEKSAGHTYRRVESVEFDVAVTAASEAGGGGKGRLKVFAFEAGVEGQASNRSEEISRVRFAIPITLKPSSSETINRKVSEDQNRAFDDYNASLPDSL